MFSWSIFELLSQSPTLIFPLKVLKLIYLYNAAPFRILGIDFEIAEVIEKNKLHLSGQENSKNKE